MKKTTAVLLSLLLFLQLVLPASVYAAEQSAAAAADGQETPVYPLDPEVFSYTGYYFSPYMNPEVIHCPGMNSMYITKEQSIIRYDFDTHAYTEAADAAYFEDFRLVDRFCTDNYIYYLVWNRKGGEENPYAVLGFDLIAERFDEPVMISGKFYDALGVDPAGRIYLYGSADDAKFIRLFSPTGELLDSTPVSDTVYSFIGFDKDNGNFFTVGYMNWVYWGYDHDVNVVRPGNASADQISYNDDYLFLLAQKYYNERCQQAELFDGGYLAVDATLYSNYSLYAFRGFTTENKTFEQKLSILRSYTMEDDSDFDYTAAIGTRSVVFDSKNTAVVSDTNTCLIEYDLTTGEELSRVHTAYPVLMLRRCDDGVLAIERDGDAYYYQLFSLKKPTKLILKAEKTAIRVGETTALTYQTDSDAVLSCTFTSSNPMIASVNDYGEVCGWRPGSVTVTARTSSGLEAAVTVTVTEDTDAGGDGITAAVTKKALDDNLSDHNYAGCHSKCSQSWLIDNGDGSLTCIGLSDDKICLDTYLDQGEDFLLRQTLECELPLIGGFYSGEKYNFFVFGKMNLEQDDDAEVLRIVRYDKNFKRTGSASVYGANTYIPFDAGSLDMAESNGSLYIHTCHEMYAEEGEWTHHQANMTFVLDEERCEVTQASTDVLNYWQSGYVSHSFNQFAAADGEYFFRVDHGDGYPRGIIILRSELGESVRDVKYLIPATFDGGVGENYTGATIGAFAVTDRQLFLAGSATGEINPPGSSEGGETEEEDEEDPVEMYKNDVRNVFFLKADKTLLSESAAFVWLTDYEDDSLSVGNPYLVKIGPDQFLILWEESCYSEDDVCTKTRMATISSQGILTSEIIETDLRLSDCEPILCTDGMVRWFYSDGTKQTLCTVNPYRLVVPTAAAGILGDTDGDGTITILDATVIQRQVAELPTKAYIAAAADVDEDGAVTIIDATAIQRFIAEIPTAAKNIGKNLA